MDISRLLNKGVDMSFENFISCRYNGMIFIMSGRNNERRLFLVKILSKKFNVLLFNIVSNIFINMYIKIQFKFP